MIRDVSFRAVTTLLATGVTAWVILSAPPPSRANDLETKRAATGNAAVRGVMGPAADDGDDSASLSESRRFAVFSPGISSPEIAGAELARPPQSSARLAAVLGPGWRAEPIGDGLGAFTLTGPAVALPAGASTESLLRIVGELPSFFPVSPGQLQPTDRAPRLLSATRQLQQMLEGVPVQGAIVRGHFDPQGRLLSIDSRVEPAAASVNVRAIPAEQALAIASRALSQDHPGIEPIGQARVEAWLARSSDGLSHVWSVRQATVHPRGVFLTTLDAQTGRILERRDAAQRALRVGRGLVCPAEASNPDDTRLVSLRNLLGRSQNPDGFLKGCHLQIEDAKGSSVSSPALRYEYAPYGAADAFDQVNAYYHFERAHRHWARDLGLHGVPWFDDGAVVPAEVNVQDVCGAFYTADLMGQGTPGFVFADQNTCGSLHTDYARDSDVIYHEFAHGVLDWSGITIAEAPMNSYQRAISEGDADYHAACLSGDPVIGELVGVRRNISNSKLYPDNVGCDPYGFREEHCTGEIWSGFLWDLHSVLGPAAETLELTSLSYLMDNWPAGHTEGIFDFWDGAVALLRADRDLNEGRNEGLLYGAAASRGFFGPNAYPDDQVSVVFQVLTRRSRFRSQGWVHAATQRVPYYFTAPSGADVTVKVRSTDGLLEPTLVLSQTDGLTRVPVASSGNAIPKGMSLETTLPDAALYVVEVIPRNGTSGAFEFTITVR